MELNDEHMEGVNNRLPDLIKKFNSLLDEEGFKHLEIADLVFRLSQCTPPGYCPSGIGRWVRNNQGGFDCVCQ